MKRSGDHNKVRWRNRAVWLKMLVLPSAVLLSACMGAFGPGAGGDSLESRCKSGLDMFEQSRCQPGQAGNLRVEAVRYELDNFRRECKDTTSTTRIAGFEQSCLPMYRQQQANRANDTRAIRAKYVSEVSSLLLDPDYPEAADLYKDLEQKAEISRDPSVEQALSSARQKLFDLASKHGIDPSYAKELQLW